MQAVVKLRSWCNLSFNGPAAQLVILGLLMLNFESKESYRRTTQSFAAIYLNKLLHKQRKTRFPWENRWWSFMNAGVGKLFSSFYCGQGLLTKKVLGRIINLCYQLTIEMFSNISIGWNKRTQTMQVTWATMNHIFENNSTAWYEP